MSAWSEVPYEPGTFSPHSPQKGVCPSGLTVEELAAPHMYAKGPHGCQREAGPALPPPGSLRGPTPAPSGTEPLESGLVSVARAGALWPVICGPGPQASAGRQGS